MVELISVILLFVGLLGACIVLFNKLPSLSKLSEPSGEFKELIISKAKTEVQKIPAVKDLSYELYLQKFLSRIRVLTLKTDHKTSGWLERLRQKNSQKNQTNNNHYWDELKKAKRGK
ncbi:MAG: hypothetical protein Q8P63_00480 [Candidatus Nealsonbacteria bacterium]|nr:hypothetical protein [Candidatus Nealsonbacteria bacterium]